MTRREEILAQLDDIASLPPASTEIVQQLNDPEADFAQVVRAFECSPELTTNLLRIANSAKYGTARTLSSVRDALVRLGVCQATQLVLASSVAPLASREVRGYDLPHGKLLEHSLAVAVAADALCRRLARTGPADAFTTGLLHDLGKIALGTQLEVVAEPILDLAFHEQVSFEQAEFRILGIDHAEVGKVLLERWMLPNPLVVAVHHHHNPNAFRGDAQTQFMTDVVHVADLLALETGIGTGIDGLNYQVCREATLRLGMRHHMAEAVICDTLARLDEMRGALESLGGS